ncbi:MAG: response regulator [Drouetiella hepatica Uher 2000/2452]|uniref:histidine kinase n=1 Tax=Drouetiella hepatica Uher 2000/2452 TaxID=904376 RepID=A0A951QBI2_9CYAN|nr:response regulator [Drouetiella hepatica Uher 2000/2452]
MDILSLRDFLIDVPACAETESLSQVWQTFLQTSCSQIVVTDRLHVALGVLSLHRFMPYISQSAGDQISTESLLNQMKTEGQTLLEPIASLSIDSTLQQLQPYLDTAAQQNWVLVDHQGQYVGLLDRLALLQRLTTDLSWVIPPNPVVQPATSVQPDSSSVPLLDPLVDLLERLPIPLMLQTSTGRIITQNLVWRRQVGGLQDPGQIRQEAALLLETIAPLEQYTAVSRYSALDAALAQQQVDSAQLPEFYTGSWDHASSLLEGSRYDGACRLSAEPGACVCTCPMKDGQDQVWQFVKISMGTVPASSLHLSEMPSLEVPSLFKLATLNFHPDPEWRSLMQTESLWLVLAQDMTEQHQVAKELTAKNADLVQLNRLKDEFLACVSHELKTPLTAVLGLSSLLKEQMLGKLNDRQSRYAQLIHQSSRHLVLIVNNILDLTQIETGQLDLSFHSVEIEAVCVRAYDQAQQNYKTEASSKAEGDQSTTLQFDLKIQPGLEHLVADEMRLRQMLTNLLSNAIKFTPVGDIGLRVEAWEGWIAFTVWDTGIGIPADKQHLIFQKFQQLENPLTRRFDGTGLGLVLTQRLARMHGGDVTFISQENRGSEFTLLLPPSPPQMRSHPSEGNRERSTEHSPAQSFKEVPAPLTTTSNNHLVLIVEADSHAIESLTHHLTDLGYRVAIARSGTEALEKARRLQPCAIFLNPILPLLSGWDLLTLLKADDATRQIPTVVTAIRLEKNLAYQNGADGFLSLPVQVAALEHCLERSIRPQEVKALRSLTVLHLREQTSEWGATSDITQLLHPYQYRVLEVDDLEQADLLARVWQPDVMLIDGGLANPLACMKQLSQSAFLAALPLVTMTPEITQAANQVAGLAIFPCFAAAQSEAAIASEESHVMSEAENSMRHHSQDSTLLQVIQIAAGIQWKPNILVADFSILEAEWLNSGGEDGTSDRANPSANPSGLQALTQYINTAGFRSTIGSSWRSILRQLQHQSVDLMLLYVHGTEPHPLFARISQDLQQLSIKPFTLIWHCNAYPATASGAAEEFNERWGAIASQILPPCVAMSDLLAEINHVLAKQENVVRIKREKR